MSPRTTRLVSAAALVMSAVFVSCMSTDDLTGHGSTGQRSADLIIPAGGPYVARLYTTRWVDVEITPGVTSRIVVHGEESDAIDVESMVVVPTTQGKGRGKQR